MFRDFFSDFVTFWVVVDPIGTIPVFLAVTKHLSHAQRNRAAVRGTLVSAGILIAFIVGGQVVLREMGIELYSFQIAGGLVLFVFALMMVFDKINVPEESEEGHDVAVYPIAVPSIATPGAMMAVVLLTDNDRYSIVEQALTTSMLLLVLAITCVLMLAAGQIQRVIGKTGINIISRVMGMILAAVAVQAVLNGLDKHLHP